MRFFFYGTLLDRDVTALVLGRRLPPATFTPATLPGHARRRIKGGSYPIAVRDPKSEVAGAIVRGLSARDVARLAAYEGPRYRIAPLKVRIAGVLSIVSVFAPLEETLKEQIEHTRSVYVQRPPAIDGVRRYVEAILSTTRANKRLFIAYINALAFHAQDFCFAAGGRTPPSFQETLIELEKSSAIGSGRLKIHDTHFELRLILLFLFSVAMFDDLFFTKEEFSHTRIVESLVKLLTMGVGLPGDLRTNESPDALNERIRQLEEENTKLRQIVIDRLLEEQSLSSAQAGSNP